jgi:hypothetical protein
VGAKRRGLVEQVNEIALYYDIVLAVEQETKRSRVDMDTLFEASVSLTSTMNRLNLLHLASDVGGVIWCLEKLRRYLKVHGLEDKVFVERHKRPDGDVLYYFADDTGNPVMLCVE